MSPMSKDSTTRMSYSDVVFSKSMTDLSQLYRSRVSEYLPFHKAAKHILQSAFRSFCLVYGVRAAISVSIRLIFLMRTSPKSLCSLTSMVGEQHLKSRVPSIRLGLFAGSFVGIFETMRYLLRHLKTHPKPKTTTLIAGGCAGVSILAATPEMRRTLALYSMTRLAQCIYNAFKQRGLITPIPHGDALIFILSSAQIMYAYVMRPDTLNNSFWKFIAKTGPIHPVMLEAVKLNNRNLPINVEKVNTLMENVYRTSSRLETALPSSVGCSHFLHPTCPSCWKNVVRVFFRTAWVILPQYSALTFVPLVAFRWKTLIRAPASVLSYGVFSLARSTAFISGFVSLYQAAICASRQVSHSDHRGTYFMAGIISSLSIFIERPTKRSELALYTLPRGADSLAQLLVARRLMYPVPYSEVWMFMASTSGLMYFFWEEPEHLSWLLKALFKILFDAELDE